jgi:outer membrane cobalamin receptor
MRRIVVVLACAASMAACTHRPTGSRNLNSSVITREEIEQSRASNAYDVISRLRGRYLVSHGKNSFYADPQTYPVVFLNNQEYGALSVLRNISTDGIEEIHYYTGTDATQKFGKQYGGGVIQLISRSE